MDSVTALNADVVWHANTGKAEVDIERLRRQFHEATDSMSTQALRASAAQDRLDRALIKHGTTSTQAKNAEAALRRETEAATVSAGHHASALSREERSVERLGRGAIVGSGAIRGLARAAVFASTSFVGGFGLAFAIRTVITEASRHQIIINQTRQALERQGVSWAKNRAQIDETIQAQSKLSAFEDEQLYPSFTALFRRTGDVNEALKLNALAADVARGRNVDLNTAVTLVTRASIGQVGSLRRLGIDVSAVTTNVDKLKASTTNVTKAQLDAAKAADKQATQSSIQALLLEKYGGSAKAFGDSAAGAQAKFTNALHDSGEVIGKDLLPEGTKLLKQGTAYLDQLNQSGRLQHDVNVVMRDGGRIVRGIKGAFHDLHVVLGPVVDALGGVQVATKLVLEAMAVAKLVKIAGAVRGIGIQWGFVATQERAAATAAPAAGAATAGGVAAASGLVRGGIRGAVSSGAITRGYGGSAAAFLAPLVAGYALAYSETGEASHHVGGPLDVNVGPGDLVSYRDPITGKYVLMHGYRGGNLKNFISRDVLHRHPELARPAATGEDVGQRGAGTRQSDSIPSLSSRPPRPPIQHEFALPQRFVIAEARVQAEGTEADQLAVYRQEIAYVRAQIRSGKLTKKSLADAYNEETQLNGQIKQIRDAEAARRRAAAARRRAEEAKRRAEEAKRHREYLDALHATETQLRARSEAERRGGGVTQPVFTAEGPQFYKQAYQRNRQFAKAGPYQTKLTPAQEKRFRQWVKDNKVPFDPNEATPDYDMRGYWLAMVGGQLPDDARWKGGKTHFPDTFKTPYDTTFSRESKYATADNPLEWRGDQLIDRRTGRVVYGQRKKTAEDALVSFYRREAHDAKLTRTQRAHYADLAQKEREADLKRARSDREQALRNAVARAQLTKNTLDDDRKADKALIAFYRKEEHDKTLTRSELLQIEAKRIAAQKALASLKKPLSIDFFSEAAANFRTYGSNVGDVLSGQDARGLLARIALTLEKSERHAKSTATTNKQLVKSGPHPAKTAAALADVGAWTQ